MYKYFAVTGRAAGRQKDVLLIPRRVAPLSVCVTIPPTSLFSWGLTHRYFFMAPPIYLIWAKTHFQLRICSIHSKVICVKIYNSLYIFQQIDSLIELVNQNTFFEQEKEDSALVIISIVGVVISMLFTVLTVGIYIYLWK